MKLVRLRDIRISNPKLYHTIRARQRVGSMKEYLDNEGNLCYDENELHTYVADKGGRPPKLREQNKNN